MSGLTIPFTGLKKQYNNLRTEILDATDEVLRSGQLMNGNYTAEFENWLAKKNRVKYAITCHSGSQALEIIAQYYNDIRVNMAMVNPPRALVPSMTFVATANAFRRAGWEIHFVDTDKYGILNPRSVPDDLGYQAVVAVGLYGASTAHLGEIKYWSLANKIRSNMVWIEDAAQHWLSADCQRYGDSAAISFDPMKNLANFGNGGAIVTNNLDLVLYAREWREHGKPGNQIAGSNSRMSEVDCAQMMVKTRHLDKWQERRQAISVYWVERLKKSGIRSLIDDNTVNGHAFHKFVIDVDNRDLLQRNLEIKKIETRVHYKEPLHEIGVFREYSGPDLLAVSSSLARRVLSLPLYPELTDLEVEYVIDSVLDSV